MTARRARSAWLAWLAWLARPARTAGRRRRAAGRAAALLLLGSACAPRPDPPPPAFARVVLVTVDTLRADHLELYGYGRAVAPFLARLGAEGVVFENAMATASHTAPSHASLLTGLHPPEHGVLNNGEPLPAGVSTLGHVFGAAGYETAAVLSLRFLEGVARGFGVVDGRYRPGAETVRRALEWFLDERRSERFLLWVHLFDPHEWLPPEPAAERGLREGPIAPAASDWLRQHGISVSGAGRVPLGRRFAPDGSIEPVELTQEGYARAVERYDALISYVDAQVERLFDVVETFGLPGPSLWVVTADHGEGLGSHGYGAHGRHVYAEQLRVPLLLRASDGSLPPRRIAELVSAVDLAPTFAELLGVAAPADPAPGGGVSLLATLLGRALPPAPRLALAQRRSPRDGEVIWPGERGDLHAARRGPYKYLLRSAGPDEFYDLDADPGELVNRVDEPSPERDRLRRLLETRLARREAAPGGAPPRPGAVSPDVAEELRALGYAR